MKIGVSSYSFSSLINKGEITQKDTVRLAKEIGFDAIEFTELKPDGDKSIEEYAKEIKNEAENYGMEISAYVCGADLSIKDNEKEIKHLKGCVDIANILGTKIFRHDVMFAYGDFRSFDEALPYACKAIKAVSEYAEKYGIKTVTENHGLICQDPDRMERLVSGAQTNNFGLLLDIGNFMCADVDNVSAVARLANLAYHVHAKDFIYIDYNDKKDTDTGFVTRGLNLLNGTAVGKGDANTKRCIEILKRNGYDGYIDIEFEGDGNCIDELTFGLKYLRNII